MVGIVIVNYKSDELSSRFVSEELCKTVCPHRTVIVDVGGTLGEVPDAVVLKEENKGFAHACNVGAMYLKGEVSSFLFSNNDVKLTSSNVVEVLEDTLRRHSEAGAVGPEILGPDGHRQGPAQYMGMWTRFVWMYLSTPFLSKERKRELFHLFAGDGASEGLYHFISASFMLVDADAFFQAGMFDEHTFLYAEENILSDRMAVIGKQFYFNPSVSVFHEKGATVGKTYAGRQQALMQMRSMAYYYRKYRSYTWFGCTVASLLHRMILLFK